MLAEKDFTVPPPKRRRTSQDSSEYSPRSVSRERSPPRDEPERSRRKDDRSQTRSRSRSRSHDNDGRFSNREDGQLPYRRRNRSRASEYSNSSRSRSRSASRLRSRSRRSRSGSQHSQEVSQPQTPYPYTDGHKKLSFKTLHTLSRAHGRGITSVKFSPDLSLLAVASADASITIYSITQPLSASSTPIKHLRTLRAHLAGINALAWSPVGPNYTLASASDDKSILLWSPLASDFPISPSPLLGHSNYVYSLAFSPKGNMLVSGSYDEAVFLWDVRSARVMRSLPAHSDPVSGVDFLRDGSMVCSCAEDGLIRIWDSGTGQCLKTLVDEDRKPVTAVRFTPNGKFVVAWTLDGCIRLWRYTEGTCVKTYTGHVNKDFSLSGTIGEYMQGQEAFLVSGSEDGEVVAWDVTSKEILWRGKGHEDVVLSVDYGKLSDGRGLLVSAGKDRDIRFWIEDIEPTITAAAAAARVNGVTGDAKEHLDSDVNGQDVNDTMMTMMDDADVTRTHGGDVKMEDS